MQSFSEIMAVLATSYPNFKLTAETIRVYKLLLSDIPVEYLQAGALKHATENKWFPSVAELRSAAFDVMMNKPGVPSAFEAWQEAIEHCRRGDYTGYSHPLIEKAVNVIGIPYWQSMETSDEMATRAQFIRVYESLFTRAEEDVKRLPAVTAQMTKNNLLVDSINKVAKRLSGASATLD